jgi:hypothetical protein
MTRLLYRGLLRMHPSAFRRQFAPEMLAIFEDTAVTEGAAALLFDAVISLLRQWLLRSGLWKAVVAILGAALQVIPPLWMSTRPRAGHILPTRGVPIQADGLLAVTSFMIFFVAAMIAAVVLWSAHVARIAARCRDGAGRQRT